MISLSGGVSALSGSGQRRIRFCSARSDAVMQAAYHDEINSEIDRLAGRCHPDSFDSLSLSRRGERSPCRRARGAECKTAFPVDRLNVAELATTALSQKSSLGTRDDGKPYRHRRCATNGCFPTPGAGLSALRPNDCREPFWLRSALLAWGSEQRR